MPNTRMTRMPEKGVDDLAQLHALLDGQYVAHVGLVRDGRPVVVPTGIARDGDRVLLHGSTGSGWMRLLADGADACVTVTSLHGVVVARSVFESSFHYRSAVLFGRFAALEDTAKQQALDVVVEKLIPGRWDDTRPSTEQELKGTAAVAVEIESASAKVRTGMPSDEPEDLDLPTWAGVIPVRQVFEDPIPEEHTPSDMAVPGYLRDLVNRNR